MNVLDGSRVREFMKTYEKMNVFRGEKVKENKEKKVFGFMHKIDVLVVYEPRKVNSNDSNRFRIKKMKIW